MRITRNVIVVMSVLAMVLSVMPAAAGEAGTPAKVTQPGTYVTKARTDNMVAVVGYRLAATSPRDDWLIVELALSAHGGKTATIRREDVWVIAPDGTRVPLAGQKEFGAAYNDLRSYLRRMVVTRDPLGYFPPLRRSCDIQFFAEPGRKVVFDQVQVDQWRVCDGILAFKLPGGFTPGRWTLVIRQPQGEIHMPMDLGPARAD